MDLKSALAFGVLVAAAIVAAVCIRGEAAALPVLAAAGLPSGATTRGCP
jgi:hypothetical protein